MLRPTITIQFDQQPSDKYPGRGDTLIMPFVTECEVSSSWKNLTDTAKLKFPKNISVRLPSGGKVNLSSTPNAAGIPVVGNSVDPNTQPPFILRGDRITITAGYRYFDKQLIEQKVVNEIFTGYITKVTPRMPIEIECEDSMYRLKQIMAPNKFFPGSSYDAGKIVKELLAGTPFTVNTNGESTNIGDFRTQNETIAQVLERLRKDCRIECWFRGTELRVAAIVYFPDDARTSVFAFQKNICQDDSLEYTREDDVQLAIKAYSINKVELTATNKNGHNKTKKKRLEVLVSKQNGSVIATQVSNDQNKYINGGNFGEVRTLYFWNVGNVNDLIKLATDNLNRFYYEGFRGSFVTLGLPFVRHGDQVILKDNLLPERGGTYFVKGVTYTYGMSGYRQKIELDMRIDDVLSPDQIAQGI